MRIVVFLVGMAVLAWLASDYISNNRIHTPDGAGNPNDIMAKAQRDAKKIEDDMAKRAAAPMPGER